MTQRGSRSQLTVQESKGGDFYVTRGQKLLPSRANALRKNNISAHRRADKYRGIVYNKNVKLSAGCDHASGTACENTDNRWNPEISCRRKPVFRHASTYLRFSLGSGPLCGWLRGQFQIGESADRAHERKFAFVVSEPVKERTHLPSARKRRR